jgi:hypothetical protein
LKRTTGSWPSSPASARGRGCPSPRTDSRAIVARAPSGRLSEFWGQPVAVENLPGLGSTAAPALVAKSPPDGYTLLVTSAQAYSAIE